MFCVPRTKRWGSRGAEVFVPPLNGCACAVVHTYCSMQPFPSAAAQQYLRAYMLAEPHSVTRHGRGVLAYK